MVDDIEDELETLAEAGWLSVEIDEETGQPKYQMTEEGIHEGIASITVDNLPELAENARNDDERAFDQLVDEAMAAFPMTPELDLDREMMREKLSETLKSTEEDN
jgi:hypothetical protein